VPSHAITKASGLLVVFVAPTAVQAMAEVHDTAFRVLPPGSLGVDWTAQVVPSQASANAVTSAPSGPNW
jgi:hypothetical protein